MNPINIVNKQTEELINAQMHIWNHLFSFLNSMTLKCAIELGIPDAIKNHGSPMTLAELALSLAIHPKKAPSLPRLMGLLTQSNFFSKQTLTNGEEAYDLTINSQLLLKDHPITLVPFSLLILNSTMVEPSHHLSRWFKNGDDETPFHIAHNMSSWEYSACVPKFNVLFNEGMESDSQFVASLLMVNHEFNGLIKGLESLVDVGGGNGTMTKAIAKVFPELTCIVFDLPHVVKGLHDYANIKYVAGDMFESIPSAQAVLLKWILHDWSDEHCIKILQHCKEALPSKNKGGKVIIIDMVVEANNATQFMFDMEMMSLNIGGKERTEEQWKKLFEIVGFNDYKIFQMLGPRSVIEVYP